jgi:hypothetical protein
MWAVTNSEWPISELRARAKELHRFFGVELNNGTWDLLEQVDGSSPVEEQERLLYGAYAACRHWLEAGDAANHARGEYMIARAALKLGKGALGLEHAQRCLELVLANPGQMADWDEPFAREALARGLAAINAPEAARIELERSVELTGQVADPADQEILRGQLAMEPWFGLR